MLGILGQDLGVEPFRLGDGARLVQAYCLIDGALQGKLGGFWEHGTALLMVNPRPSV